jgi:hypothetical protein
MPNPSGAWNGAPEKRITENTEEKRENRRVGSQVPEELDNGCGNPE